MRGLVVALSVSVGLHGLAFSVLPVSEIPMVAGGGPGATLRLGNGFADLAAGQTAVPVETSMSGAAAPVEPAEPAELKAVQPLSTTQAPKPQVVPAAAPVAATTVKTTDSVTGQEPEPKPKPDPKPEPKAQPKPGAETNQRAGQAGGTEVGQATTRAETSNAGGDGGAKASNYPGIVMKKLMKTRKDRVSGRGTALVGFTLGFDGSIAKAKIVRSSGSDAVDKAALALVARAAPFPPPPKGAERSFSFEFSGG